MLSLQKATLTNRIENIDLQIEAGQCWHLLGNNGAGKSSLLGLMAGSLRCNSGSILYKNALINSYSIAELALTRCFLQQLPVAEFNISLQELFSFYTQQASLPAAIEHAMGLTSLMHKPLRQLSGGQQQRFHIARCLTQVWPAIESGKALVLLDEPCQHLDLKYQSQLYKLLSGITQKNNTVVLSTHHVNQSVIYASHVAWIKQHTLMSSGTSDSQMNIENLTKAFEHPFYAVQGNTSDIKYFAPLPI